MTKFFIACIMFLSMMNLKAEMISTLNLTSGYNNNGFKLDSGLSSFYNQISYDNYNEFGDFYLNIGGAYLSLINLPERNLLNYYTGLNYNLNGIDTSETPSSQLIGIQFSSLNGLNSYSDFNSYLFGMLWTYTKTLTQSSSLSLSTQMNYKIFSQLSDLNNFTNQTNLDYRVSFESKTSISIGTSLNTKLFGSENMMNATTSQNNSKIEDELLVMKQKGKNMQNRNSDSSGMMNNSTMNFIRNTNILINADINLKIAQNLYENTGISLLLSKSFQILEKNNIGYYYYDFIGDEDLFDDPFSYNNESVSLAITQIIADKYNLKFSANYINKSYNYEVINQDGNYYQRNDNNYSIELNLNKEFKFEDSFINYLTTNININYIKNYSNETNYNYNGLNFNLGIELSF